MKLHSPLIKSCEIEGCKAKAIWNASNAQGKVVALCDQHAVELMALGPAVASKA